MKKYFEIPEAEIVKFECEDVITTSSPIQENEELDEEG